MPLRCTAPMAIALFSLYPRSDRLRVRNVGFIYFDNISRLDGFALPPLGLLAKRKGRQFLAGALVSI
jgi:hypothetical protein